MKKLLVVLVMSVSGLGYSQSPSDTIPEENINLNLINQCVIDEVNKERKKIGLNPLVISEEAMEFSKKHTEWVVNTGRFEHSNDEVYGECMNKSGFFDGETYVGASKRIVNGWMKSSPHRKVLMSDKYELCGTHTIYRYETPKEWYSISSFTLKMYQ